MPIARGTKWPFSSALYAYGIPWSPPHRRSSSAATSSAASATHHGQCAGHDDGSVTARCTRRGTRGGVGRWRGGALAADIRGVVAAHGDAFVAGQRELGERVVGRLDQGL